MGNLVTTAGEDVGESATNQLLGSAFAEAEAPCDVPPSQRREGRPKRTDGPGAAVRRGRRTSRQPSPTPISLGSRASLVPREPRSSQQAAQRGGSVSGRGPDHRGRRQTDRTWAPRPQPQAVVSATRQQGRLRAASAVAARSGRPRASPSSPPSLAPVPEHQSQGSPSDEQRMLPGPQLSPPVSAPEIRRLEEARDDHPPPLPVDAVVNAGAPPRRMSAFRRLSQFKRGVFMSGVTLSLGCNRPDSAHAEDPARATRRRRSAKCVAPRTDALAQGRRRGPWQRGQRFRRQRKRHCRCHCRCCRYLGSAWCCRRGAAFLEI
ncbi:hypothetical protein MTO96_033789 [Rhipicephalus appendiculatus]